MSNRKPAKVEQEIREPSHTEAQSIREATSRLDERRRPVRAEIEVAEGQPCTIGPDHADGAGWTARYFDAFGTASPEFANSAFADIMSMSTDPGEPGKPVNPQRTNAMLAAVDSVRPRDEIEAQLAVQMATTHAFAMECMRRAHRAPALKQYEAHGNLATKMLRTFTAQVEALAKLRRGGEQRVVVQHIHVGDGGQAAIAGSVQHGGGGGDQPGIGHRAHAPALASHAVAAVLPLRGENEIRHVVPGPGREGEGAVQDARRREGERRAAG